jgi:DNA-binding GntR family transcriptional regulator
MRRVDVESPVNDLAANIDRRSPVPLYFQLERAIEQQITSGRLRPGDRLPSEPTLTEDLQVSRSVVRQALNRLEQDGLLRRVKGRGTFVAESSPRSWLLQSGDGFFQDEVGRLGRSVTSRVLRCEVETLPSWACHALGLPEFQQGVTLERVRAVDGLVSMYNVNHLRDELAPTVRALDDNGSLYEALHKRDGLVVCGGSRRVDAVLAGERMAELLEVDAGAPLLFVESVSWDQAFQPFDCYRTWLRPDRMKLAIQVGTARSAELEPASAVDIPAV